MGRIYDANMDENTFQHRRKIERLEPEQLAELQLQRCNALLAEILPQNRFYAEKLSGQPFPLTSLERLTDLPFTFKEELLDGDASMVANSTFPAEQYVRFHQTSGTRGRPLVVLDTAEDWQWWKDTWQFVLDAAQITEADRAFLAFSFGPFIGFWSAHDALVQRKVLVIPSGGLSTLARLALLRSSRASAVFCTPSYALRMAEVAAENEFDLQSLPVKAIVVAGEPGGSVPAIRSRIENAWQARVVDHAGATEVGPWGYTDPLNKGLHIVESEFIAEFLSVDAGAPAGEGELSELVLTCLGRAGSPVIRYRTGDLVRPTWNSDGDIRFVLLEGGLLGRSDDMMIVRGVNVFPSAIEQILHSFPEIVEYRMTAHRTGEMDGLTIEIEDRLEEPQRVKKELLIRLGLRVDVQTVPMGSLPRFAGKGKRFIDNRSNCDHQNNESNDA